MQTTLHEIQMALQIVLGTIFLVASVGKVKHPRKFAMAVAQYRIVPQSLTTFASCIVISGEVLIAGSHLTGYFLLTCIWPTLILIASFAAAVLMNLARGRVVPCYCFGNGDTAISKSTVARLLLMAAGELVLALIRNPLYPLQLGLVELLPGILWAIVVVIISIWLLRIPDLIYLSRPVRIFLGGDDVA